MTTYDQVVKAAQRLVTDDTRDTWGLSEAVLAHVPDATSGKGFAYDPGSGGVQGALSALADRMHTDGITTPSGDYYTEASLANLREQAMTWDPTQRHPEAAYSTHREAGSPNSEGGKVLNALCAVARGESPAKPRGIDAGAWGKAVTRVQTRRKGFPVAANDVNVALQRKTNGSRSGGSGGGKVTKADIQDAIESGDLDPAEVADILPTNTLVDTWAGRREEETVGPLTEGMSPEEVTRSGQLIDALQSAVDGMSTIAKDTTEGWWQHDLIHAQHYLVSVLRHVGAEMTEDMVAFLIEHTVEIRRVLDMIEMKARGTDLPDEVEHWLASQAAS